MACACVEDRLVVMSLPYQPPNVISDDQRERAVSHLQAQYANGTIGEAEHTRFLVDEEAFMKKLQK